MKAVCVTPERTLQVRDIGCPEGPAPGHVLVDIEAATITHGDKFFLNQPLPGNAGTQIGQDLVYGANAAGKVVAIGSGVPTYFAGRTVAIYKSLSRTAETMGVWCERAHVHQRSCLVLPESVDVRDYCGSFANVLTVYAFLSEIGTAGHHGVVVTAGNSATGRVAASLLKRQNVPAIFLARSQDESDQLTAQGVEHVLDITSSDFEQALEARSRKLRTTAVFDGVGGPLLDRIVPNLPSGSTIFIYGFLGALEPARLSTALIMQRDIRLRRFANLESAVVSDPERLAGAIRSIEGLIDDPLLTTKIGKTFSLDHIVEAMSYDGAGGARPILIP